MTDHEPNPMDPERLALARKRATLKTATELHSLLAELLADRDGQEDRAVKAERNHAQHLDLLGRIEADLRRALAEARSRADQLDAEVTRLRARASVEAEDVERAGVTRAQIEAWLATNGWRNSGRQYSDGTSYWVRGDGGTGVLACSDAVQTVLTFADLAHIHNRAGLDILDEMAAMPTPEPRDHAE